jgi:hypothetical protein
MKTGCPQGSPLSTLWFNLTQAGPVSRVCEAYPAVTILSFHDDHFVIGEPEEALKAFDLLVEELQQINLQVCASKSQVYSAGVATLDQQRMLPFRQRGFEVVPPSRGIIVAGAPVGSNHFLSQFHMELVDKVKAQIDSVTICRVPAVLSGCRLQTTYFLIRKCVMTQLNYYLRVCPPESNIGAARDLDHMVLDRMVAILGVRKFLPGTIR